MGLYEYLLRSIEIFIENKLTKEHTSSFSGFCKDFIVVGKHRSKSLSHNFCTVEEGEDTSLVFLHVSSHNES